MADSLSELKQTSAERFEKLRALMRLDLGVHKRSRLMRAGCAESKFLLHDSIAKHHATLLQDDYKKRWETLTRDLALERLRFLTVLHSVVPLNQREAIRAVERMESALERVLKGTGAKLLGAVEVEIVNIALLRKIGSLGEDETRKLHVLESITASDADNASRTAGIQDTGVLVHFHGIVDLGVRNSLLREDELRKGAKKIAAWQWTIEIIKRSDTAQGFEVLPRRWVVERTFAWLGRCRRLAKDFEATIASAVAWAFVAHIRTLTRRLARA